MEGLANLQINEVVEGIYIGPEQEEGVGQVKAGPSNQPEDGDKIAGLQDGISVHIVINTFLPM